MTIKYYNEDCFNSQKYITDNSVDMFFCDPPYFISGKKNNKIDLKNGNRADWDRQWENENEYYDWTKNWISLSYSQLKSTGSIYVCISWQHSGKIQNILEECGYIVQNRITWKRDKGRGSLKNWKSMHEDIWFATKSEDYTFNIDAVKIEKKVIAPYRDENGDPKDWFEKDGKKIRMTCPGNLWTEFVVPFWSMKEVRSYAKSKKSENNTLVKHNTQKPKDLVKKCILASSNKEDLVVDYFSGSGTTAISSEELNRNSIVFDINSQCIEMLKSRIKNELECNLL
jgi:site-specific DNA-methyltransferase (adenine-specific)